MLDECVAPKSARLLVQALKLHKPPIESQFLEDWIKALPSSQEGATLPYQGAHDADWTVPLKQQDDWCVVSCDTGKSRGEIARTKGPPLHLILPAQKITGYFLGGKIANHSGFEKVRAIYYVFPDIIESYNASP